MEPEPISARADVITADVITADVIILGGGLVGLTLAAALDAGGLSAIVVDPVDPAVQAAAGYDGRATAVASASWRMLEVIGVADAFDAMTHPRPFRNPVPPAAAMDELERGAGSQFDPVVCAAFRAAAAER